MNPRVGIEPTTSRFYRHTLCRCTTTGLNCTKRTNILKSLILTEALKSIIVVFTLQRLDCIPYYWSVH